MRTRKPPSSATSTHPIGLTKGEFTYSFLKMSTTEAGNAANVITRARTENPQNKPVNSVLGGSILRVYTDSLRYLRMNISRADESRFNLHTDVETVQERLVTIEDSNWVLSFHPGYDYGIEYRDIHYEGAFWKVAPTAFNHAVKLTAGAILAVAVRTLEPRLFPLVGGIVGCVTIDNFSNASQALLQQFAEEDASGFRPPRSGNE